MKTLRMFLLLITVAAVSPLTASAQSCSQADTLQNCAAVEILTCRAAVGCDTDRAEAISVTDFELEYLDTCCSDKNSSTKKKFLKCRKRFLRGVRAKGNRLKPIAREIAKQVKAAGNEPADACGSNS